MEKGKQATDCLTTVCLVNPVLWYLKCTSSWIIENNECYLKNPISTLFLKLALEILNNIVVSSKQNKTKNSRNEKFVIVYLVLDNKAHLCLYWLSIDLFVST